MKKQIGKFIAVLLPFGVDVLPLLVGQGISKIGDSMLLVALNLTVFQSTHSGTLVGLLDMAIVLPTIVLGPVAGTLVDHGHLKRILLLTSFFQAAMLAILIPYQSNIYVLLVVLFLVSAISSFYMPAFFSLPPRLVTEENALLRLNSTLSITALLASILGASIGGIALFFIGIRGVIIVDLISFVILAVCIFLIKIPQQVADSEISLSLRWKSFYSSVIDGIREIYKHSSLRGLMTIFFIYSY